MTPGTGWQPDDEFLARVKRAYRLSIRDWAGAGRSMWSAFFRRQAPIHDALLSDDLAALRSIVSNPGSTDLYYGVDNLCATFIDQQPRAPLPEFGSGDEISHGLLQLVPIVGGQGRDPFDVIDRALRQRIEFPNPFRGEFGTVTERGVASYRPVQALYQAYRILQLLPNGRRMVEIGPGMGRTAYYAYKAGITDYTTIDLPMGVVAQACFLGATLGPDHIWMNGDPESEQPGRIRLLSSSIGMPEEQFDLVLNVDSLTEMDPVSALHYAQWIASHSPLFLSINHDVNMFTAAEICRWSFAGKIRSSRAYPLRVGYQEELIETGAAYSWLQARVTAGAVLSSRRLRLAIKNRLPKKNTAALGTV